MQILGESLVGIRRWSVGALVEQNHDVCAPQFIARLAGWGSAACRGDLFANCAQDADAVGAQKYFCIFVFLYFLLLLYFCIFSFLYFVFMPRRPFCKLCPRCRCCPCPNSSGTIFQTGKSFWLWGEHLDKGDLFANLFIFNFFKNQFPKVQHFSTLNFWGLRCLPLSFRSKSLLVTSRRILEQLFQPFSHACYGLSGEFFKRRL